jgi:hypothetical protein
VLDRIIPDKLLPNYAESTNPQTCWLTFLVAEVTKIRNSTGSQLDRVTDVVYHIVVHPLIITSDLMPVMGYRFAIAGNLRHVRGFTLPETL